MDVARRPRSIALALLIAACTTAPSQAPSASSATSAVGRVTDGLFVLEIESPKSQYEPGEAIDVTGSLTYTGPEASIHIVHDSPALGFGLREPIFGRRLSTVFDALHSGSTLRPAVPLELRFQKSGGYLDLPDPSFIAYKEDPVFWLPTGTWHVYVTAQFPPNRRGDRAVTQHLCHHRAAGTSAITIGLAIMNR